jgi:DNA-binding HxlR family transcriptional regulator
MPESSRSDATLAPRRSSCPIACSLDLLGDRWTLLVVRDLFRGRTRYGEFLASTEGIPTNILAERLKRLEAAGLIKGKAYQKNPPRYAYTLTPKGTGLRPVLAAFGLWAHRFLPRTQADKDLVAVLSKIP